MYHYVRKAYTPPKPLKTACSCCGGVLQPVAGLVTCLGCGNRPKVEEDWLNPTAYGLGPGSSGTRKVPTHQIKSSRRP